MKFIKTYNDEDYSIILERALFHNGTIVDIGCLRWDWGSNLIGKKRYVGIDPIETRVPDGCELFNGIISPITGNTKIYVDDLSSSIFYDDNKKELSNIDVRMLNWKDFCSIYNIDNISVLKINIEGAEYSLLNSMDDKDFNKIDQIAISFHDWLNPSWINLTKSSLFLLENSGFEIIKIYEKFGWYLAYKK